MAVTKMALVDRPRRRRWPRRQVDELNLERANLQPYINGTAHNWQMQMYAMGARDALTWALGGTEHPVGSLGCVELALGWRPRKGRSRLKSVPVFVRTRS